MPTTGSSSLPMWCRRWSPSHLRFSATRLPSSSTLFAYRSASSASTVKTVPSSPASSSPSSEAVTQAASSPTARCDPATHARTLEQQGAPTDHCSNPATDTSELNPPHAKSPRATVARALTQLNYVQRLLRRFPVGTTQRTLYFNELPSNVKSGLLKLALLDEREGSSDVPAREAATQSTEAIRLNAPTASISVERLLGSQKAVTRQRERDQHSRLPRGGTPSIVAPQSWEEAQLTVPDLRSHYVSIGLRVQPSGIPVPSPTEPSSSASHHHEEGDVAPPHSSTAAATTTTTMERRRAETIPCVTLHVTSANTAPRSDYLPTPSLFVLGIPEALLSEVSSTLTADEDRSATASRDTGSGSVVRFLQRRLVYDSVSKELLLRRPHLPDRGDRCDAPRATLERAVFLMQCYGLSPLQAHQAAHAAAETAKTSKKERATTARAAAPASSSPRPQPGYRLLFISPVAHALSNAPREPTSFSALAHHFPSSFHTYVTDCATTELLRRGVRQQCGTSSSAVLEASSPLFAGRDTGAAAAVAVAGTPGQGEVPEWSPLSMKRLRFHADSADSGGLWDTQIVDRGLGSSEGSSSGQQSNVSGGELGDEQGSKAVYQPGRLEGMELAYAELRGVLVRRLLQYSNVDVNSTTMAQNLQRSVLSFHEAAPSSSTSPSSSLSLRGEKDESAYPERPLSAEAASDGGSVVAVVDSMTSVCSVCHAAGRSCLCAVRAPRVTCVVVEPVSAHTSELAAPTCSFLGTFDLPQAMRCALYEPHHLAPTVPGGLPLASLPTVQDGLLSAQQSVMMPFLRQPRRTLYGDDTQCASAAAQGVSSPVTSPSRFVPLLWRWSELEAVTGWASFAEHFGSFHQILTPQLTVRIGNAARMTNHAFHAIPALGTSSDPFLLVDDEVFVRHVLLPAMRAYACEHYAVCPRRGLLLPCSLLTNESEEGEKGAQRRGVTLSPADLAVAVHHERLCRLLVRQRRASEGATVLHGPRSTPPPFALKELSSMPSFPFLCAHQYLLSEAEDEERNSAEVRSTRRAISSCDNGLCLLTELAVIPIADFLTWAVTPPREASVLTPSHSRSAPSEHTSAEAVFDERDVVQCLMYFSRYDTVFDYGAGGGLTVGFALRETEPTVKSA